MVTAMPTAVKSVAVHALSGRTVSHHLGPFTTLRPLYSSCDEEDRPIESESVRADDACRWLATALDSALSNHHELAGVLRGHPSATTRWCAYGDAQLPQRRTQVPFPSPAPGLISSQHCPLCVAIVGVSRRGTYMTTVSPSECAQRRPSPCLSGGGYECWGDGNCRWTYRTLHDLPFARVTTKAKVPRRDPDFTFTRNVNIVPLCLVTTATVPAWLRTVGRPEKPEPMILSILVCPAMA